MGLDQAVPKECGELFVGRLGWTHPEGAVSNARDCLNFTGLALRACSLLRKGLAQA